MKAPIIVLIILLFVAIFLYGSVLEPYTGEGLYYGRVQLADGVQWLDTVIRFEPIEGGQQFFTLYYIVNENSADDAPVVSMTTSRVQYSGSYFKHVFGPLFLRPTGIHFPVIDFEGHGKFVMNWEIVSSWSLDAQGQPIEGYEYTTAPHRSTNDMTETGMNFEKLPYQRVEEIPEKLMDYIDTLDAAEPAVVVEVQ